MRPVKLRPLSEPERVTLEQMYHKAPKRRLRQRAHMVLLAYKGYTLKAVSAIVDVCYNSVRYYVHAFLKSGFLALYDAKGRGRKSHLMAHQLEQIDRWLEISPRELHYQQSCWTMRLMLHRIKAVYQISLTTERVRQIVHGLGFTLVRPKHLSRLSDPEEIAKAEKDLEELHAKAQQGEIILFYQDETKLSRLPTITRMWVRTGTQYLIPTDDDHQTFWAYGVTNAITGKIHYRLEPFLYGEGFCRFLKQMRQRYPEAEIVLVVDRATAHRTKLVQEYLQEDSKMSLYQLPSYSPELNKIERLWKWMRKRVTHIHLFENILVLMEAVRNFFRYVNRVPKKVLRRLALE